VNPNQSAVDQASFLGANPLVLGILQVEVLLMLGGKLEWL